MDLLSYVRRSMSAAEIAASIAVYAGSEVVNAAGSGLRRAAGGIGTWVEKASSRGETVMKKRRRRSAA